MRNQISYLISNIKPFDDIETFHIQEILSWIESGSAIFRIQKPDIPNKHLSSYCVLYNENDKKILLINHKISGLLLPPGGHLDINEDPFHAALRECSEELAFQIKTEYINPFF